LGILVGGRATIKKQLEDIERIIPGRVSEHLYMQHIARYEFARSFVRDMVVADVACGTGYGSYDLLKSGGAKRIVGVDISEEAIRYAGEHYKADGLEFVQGDATSLNLGEEQFDVVVSFETIEHIGLCDRYLDELFRVLTPSGTAIISTPNSRFSQYNPYHINEFSPREFHSLLSQRFLVCRLIGQCHLTFARRTRVRLNKSLPRLMGLLGVVPKWLKHAIIGVRRENPRYVDADFKVGNEDMRNCVYLIAVCKK